MFWEVSLTAVCLCIHVLWFSLDISLQECLGGNGVSAGLRETPPLSALHLKVKGCSFCSFECSLLQIHEREHCCLEVYPSQGTAESQAMEQKKGVRLLHNAGILSTISGEMQCPGRILGHRAEDYSPLICGHFLFGRGSCPSPLPCAFHPR